MASQKKVTNGVSAAAFRLEGTKTPATSLSGREGKHRRMVHAQKLVGRGSGG